MKKTLKVRAQWNDFDYLDKLSPADLAFLQLFCDREYSCNKRGMAGLPKEVRSVHYQRQYQRRNDAYLHSDPLDETTEFVDPTMNPEEWLLFKEAVGPRLAKITL